MESELNVISNTTPLINFAEIDQINILRELHGQILVPGSVVTELNEKQSLFPKAAAVPEQDFVCVKEPENATIVRQFERELHAGEAACLALALDCGKSARLLLDDIAAREIAEHHGILFTGTLGVLLEAKKKGLIQTVAPLIVDLRTKARFWLHSDLEKAVLTAAGENG